MFKNKEFKIYPPDFSVTLFLHRPDDQSDAAEMVVPAPPTSGGGSNSGKALATPAVRRMAAQYNINLNSVPGTGASALLKFPFHLSFSCKMQTYIFVDIVSGMFSKGTLLNCLISYLCLIVSESEPT